MCGWSSFVSSPYLTESLSVQLSEFFNGPATTRSHEYPPANRHGNYVLSVCHAEDEVSSNTGIVIVLSVEQKNEETAAQEEMIDLCSLICLLGPILRFLGSCACWYRHSLGTDVWLV
mmetsp:Transcript_4521/g.7572  ORF Transcript_4521/g.7572 Transcript_4521/m.7572 type:complete len:117 (+) Transcript_4521:169-519(+)